MSGQCTGISTPVGSERSPFRKTYKSVWSTPVPRVTRKTKKVRKILLDTRRKKKNEYNGTYVSSS